MRRSDEMCGLWNSDTLASEHIVCRGRISLFILLLY